MKLIDKNINSKLLLLASIIISLSSCLGWSDMFAYDKKLVGPYHLSSDFSESGKGIYYEIKEGLTLDRIRPDVKAVGWNNEFMIVKQYTSDNEEKARYYIIDMQKDNVHNSIKEAVIGPMNEEEFLQKRKEISLPEELTFTFEVD